MIIKKTLKILGYAIGGFAAFVVLYLIAAFILSWLSVGKEPGASNDVGIYILTNGDHTDVVLPVKNQLKDWSREVKFENTISHDTTSKYIALGWGDKGFYLNTPTWAQLKLSAAFKAAFALSTSAIHATYYRNMVVSGSCKKLSISNNQYLRLVAFIDSSFKRDENGQVVNIKTNANYNNNDAFYDAKRKYNLFYTCNTWANNALKAAGQKACVWTPFDKGIFYQYRGE